MPSLILHLFMAAAIAANPVPAATEAGTTALAFADQEKLRCAATFAVVAQTQATGDPSAAGFPPLATRGREYFIRAVAEVMDSTGLSREALSARLRTIAAALAEPGRIEAAMPICLTSLEASGL